MRYDNIHKGKFLSRPNRFIANVEIDGKAEVCHVKNTGRCKELLIEGCTVWLEHSDSASRKTAFDLVAVEKGDRLINMDSQAPNKAVGEWLREKMPFGEGFSVYPEKKYGNSRFDFYLESQDRKIFMEVKGCTQEIGGIGYFPDAPTDRGVRHLRELMKAVSEGYKCYVAFVIPMTGITEVRPNAEIHREFAETFYEAKVAGVEVLNLTCRVTRDELEIVDK